MTNSKNHRNQPWYQHIHRSLVERRRELYFTQDPPLKDGNPFKKGGPLYIPYPEDAQGNPIFGEPHDKESLDRALEPPTHQLGD